MSKEDIPWPLWSETATKGDLITAMIYMRSVTTALAGALVAMRANDEEDLKVRLGKYFSASEELGSILTDIGGGKKDG